MKFPTLSRKFRNLTITSSIGSLAGCAAALWIGDRLIEMWMRGETVGIPRIVEFLVTFG